MSTITHHPADFHGELENILVSGHAALRQRRRFNMQRDGRQLLKIVAVITQNAVSGGEVLISVSLRELPSTAHHFSSLDL
ncbi:hypothetical protein AB0H42_33660 [Nocardia sp. NPDC050799]|uniref:hypothetical protein n=1 Tax=Nocardia sp. NPDC050799 TaxID=3154842 RepID=UPI0033F28BF5